MPVNERLDGLADDQAHEIVRRVVASAVLPCGDVGPNDDVVAVPGNFLLDQPLVDGPELLNAQVAIVDVPSAFRRVFERQRVDDVRHCEVAEPDVLEPTDSLSVEQTAVIRRKAD